MSVTAATAKRFFMPLTTLCGTEAIVGYEIAKDRAATFATPDMNFAFRSSSVISKISGDDLKAKFMSGVANVATPDMNFAFRSSSVISKISG